MCADRKSSPGESKRTDSGSGESVTPPLCPWKVEDVYICLFVFAAKFNLLLAHEIDFTINHQYFLRYFYEMIMYTFVNHINFTYVYVCLYSSF